MINLILGFILGVGFTLAVRSIDKTIRSRRARKELEFTNAVNARALQLQASSWADDVPLGTRIPSPPAFKVGDRPMPSYPPFKPSAPTW